MSKLKELTEKRSELAGALTKLGEQFRQQGEQWQDDQEKTWDSLKSQLDDTKLSIEKEKKAEERAKRVRDEVDAIASDKRAWDIAKAVPGRDDFNSNDIAPDKREAIKLERNALAGWCAGHKASDEQKAAMRDLGVDRHAPELKLGMLSGDACTEARDEHAARTDMSWKKRAMSALLGSSGGVTVGRTLISRVEVNMLAYGGFRNAAELIQTDEGGRLSWPTADDTSNVAVLVSEGSQMPDANDPNMRATTWDSYDYTSRPLKVSYRLLRDSVVDIGKVIADMLAIRFWRGTNIHFTTGSGENRPRGILNAASLGRTAASATAITADEILDLIHSIDPEYR